MTNEFELLEKPSVKGYSVKIDEYLYKRLNKHIRILKHAENKALSTQKWVTDAIIEKLAKTDTEELPQDRHLVLKINDPINEKIDSNVEHQKKFRQSYSKKRWFLEAINEKLDREEPKTKKYLEEILQTTKIDL